MLASLEACRITLERAREIAQVESDLAEIEARNGWSSIRQTSAPLVQFISLSA